MDGEDCENVRKREADPRQSLIRNGSPVKRIKLSNGHENGIDTLPMDIDEIPNGNGHAYPSPKEAEQAPTPIIVTEGPDKSTQIEKVAELGPETTYLTLSDPENPESKPVVLLCVWNPQDPTILAGAGTDKLARLWTISRGTAPEAHGHVNGSRTPYQDLVDRNSTTRNPDINPTTTALAWTSDGAAIALAYEADDEYGLSGGDSAKVTIWGADGSLIKEYPDFEAPIYCLQWNPSSIALLALIPDGNSTMITVFCPTTQRTATHSLPEHNPDIPLDALWTGDQEFLVCGGDLLVTFAWSDGIINQMRKFETREDHQLAKAIYDRHSRLLATASENGIIDVSTLFFSFLLSSAVLLMAVKIWDNSGQYHARSAHQGQITSLLWQPIPNHIDFDSNTERFLASSGEDGIISIWSSRAESKPKFSMILDGPVVALAFTPDGAFLASATTSQILIWKLDDLSVPRARWAFGPEHNWRDGSSGMWPEESQHTLSWDAHGQKLAYGINNNVSSWVVLR